MDKTRFDIVKEPNGIFTIEVREPGQPPHLVDGFDSREEAEAWINARRRSLDEPGGTLG